MSQEGIPGRERTEGRGGEQEIGRDQSNRPKVQPGKVIFIFFEIAGKYLAKY